jgi:glycerophosphoryl diester phosphodiesterase
MRADPSAGRALRIAHRGDWRLAPENSPEALVAALRVPGCDGVEFDVRAAADGVPVIIHDDTLARVQGRPDRVDSLTAGELAAAGVAALDEVLAALPSTAFLDVELKDDPGVEAVIKVLEATRGPALARAVVSSFQVAVLRELALLRPPWPRWLNAEDLSPATVAAAVDVGCVAIAAEWHAIDAQSLARAADAGLGVVAWTVREPEVLERMESLGVIAACVEGAALDA